MKEVVHVKTQEDNDYVYNNIKYDSFNKWIGYERFIILNDVCAGCYYYSERTCIDSGYKIISFEEFKSRYELKIGDTFEKDGFVCRVESEVEKWVYDKYQESYYKTKEWYSNYIVITNKEFIKQLEENAQ